ncbi:hypothetical protein B0H13DRAFT_1589721, partial [Mycena leptocephala]
HELRHEMAINCGCWMGDPGDDLATASHPSYREDAKEPLPPLDELGTDSEAPDYTELVYMASSENAGIFINHDDEWRR